MKKESRQRFDGMNRRRTLGLSFRIRVGRAIADQRRADLVTDCFNNTWIELQSPRDAAPGQIVGTQLDADEISRKDPDEVLSQPPGNVSKDGVLLSAEFKLQPEHRVRQSLNDIRFNFDGFRSCHKSSINWCHNDFNGIPT